jgi:hypothetical protein
MEIVRVSRSAWMNLVVAGLVALCSLAAAQEPYAGKKLELVHELPKPHAAPLPRYQDLKAYLMVYFKDETHSIYFATSDDGYTFIDVNNGIPVLWGNEVAEQKGVRDPHIMRGPDNAFYLSMTDLHVFGKQAGYRTTQWERPEELYSRGNNRGLILMKSYDLIHWTLARVRVDQLFPEYADIGCAWAPETIYDPSVGKLMVYFTTRIKAGPNFMVYSYADDSFTTLTTTPRRLFTYPHENVNTIDGDITRVGNKYHLFYVAHEKPGNIRHAVSDHINGGYNYERQKVDPENVGDEAPNLWRRNCTDTYVLMYDVFGANPHNMGFSETNDFVHYRNLGRFNEKDSSMKSTNFSNPKHGAVMSITPAEMQRLNNYFAKGR